MKAHDSKISIMYLIKVGEKNFDSLGLSTPVIVNISICSVEDPVDRQSTRKTVHYTATLPETSNPRRSMTPLTTLTRLRLRMTRVYNLGAFA